MTLLRLILARWAVRRARKAVRRYMRATERLAGLDARSLPPDPLVTAIAEYEAGERAYNAHPAIKISGHEGSLACEAAAAETYFPPYMRLREHAPPATSLSGVAAALSAIAEDPGDDGLVEALAVAALSYFEEGSRHGH